MSSFIFYLLNTNTALSARHFTNINSFNFDNFDPMRQVLPHFTDEETWLERLSYAQDCKARMWVLFNSVSVPKLIS